MPIALRRAEVCSLEMPRRFPTGASESGKKGSAKDGTGFVVIVPLQRSGERDAGWGYVSQ